MSADEIVADLLAKKSDDESDLDSSDNPILAAAIEDFSSAVREGKSSKKAISALRLVVRNLLSEEGAEE